VTKLLNHLTSAERNRLHHEIRANKKKHWLCKEFNISDRSYYHHKDIALGKRVLVNGPLGYYLKKIFKAEQRQKAIELKALGLTYLDIAVRLGVKQSTIFRAIHGKKNLKTAIVTPVKEQPKHIPQAVSAYNQSYFITPPSRDRLMAGR